MLIQTQKPYYTPEEYLELEEKAEYKSEYRNGEIVHITGGTTNHNKIALNLATFLKFCLKKQKYDIYIGDVRLWIPRYRQHTYPDVMVIQGEPIYTGTNTTTVMNPLLIAEVASKSTKDYDQVDKFLYYRSIPELQEYILIDQYKYHVMQYVKTDNNKWILTEYELESAVLSLQSIDFQIPFNELYEKINFTDPTDQEELSE
ncbi:Uma2 family endonuclease [Cronbergia sp. UHCC 0137]|uniref:Uma2 family endonuclease n=1 Tax=Cronbergia sp. UHCC 0137 TaxID=3110239 RepID=UPI002B1FE70B|nr:Uma2 family endonuclease [Cronbergia sp. UHCC 0137]MEA5619619.1 Uma2 family endonuclease [Cronbergia sp. UHCC 0137]